ncbi:phospholipid/cholesterol/gamma-HCH transport system substrate-binding protein [Nocardioides daedukensis]|uniref:Phospholipid/cholesterol/gamma-HCH transport system substrate-binding protein n=1 Tax=Nocardioides daedukensis TaxID=634462 RepID=A0A7Y9UW21_9ACTN|nr:MCE family protein [Nocardioides daedukensis]NYG60165.1 phospholipid/cholesterol/gamma-HCH transport system substrate-binding protein [Nocardioides daedukensis]
MIRRIATAAALCLVMAGGGCSLSLQDVPLPSLVSGPTYEVEAVFESALNLPVDSPVKMDGATVGQVTSVRVEDYAAHVKMKIIEDQPLRAGGRAEIRLTSPMGTAFVELIDGKGENLPEGSVIPLANTTKSPDVADLLASLSVVVTGGSFADIKTIIDEVNIALDQNTGDVRELMGRLNSVVTGLNDHTELFESSLDRIDTVSQQLAEDTPGLVDAVDVLTPAVTAISGQRKELLALLKSVGPLAKSSAELLTSTKTDLVKALQDAGPVLDVLVRSQDTLTRSFRGLIAFGSKTDAASPGDFSNFDLTFLLDPDALNPLPGQTTPKDPDVPDTEDPPGLPDLNLPDLGLPSLDDLLSSLQGLATGGR